MNYDGTAQEPISNAPTMEIKETNMEEEHPNAEVDTAPQDQPEGEGPPQRRNHGGSGNRDGHHTWKRAKRQRAAAHHHPIQYKHEATELTLEEAQDFAQKGPL